MSAPARIRDVRVRVNAKRDPVLHVDLTLADGGGKTDKIVLHDADDPKKRRRCNASTRRLRALCGAAGVDLGALMPVQLVDASDFEPLVAALRGRSVEVDVSEKYVRYLASKGDAKPTALVCAEREFATSEARAERTAPAPEREGDRWEAKLARSGKDDEKYDGSLGNAILVLANHKAWRSTLAFNEFSCCVITEKVPPWDEAAMPGDAKPGDWSDVDNARTRAWFERHYTGMKVSNTDTDAAVRVVAKRRCTHPLRERLLSLEPTWDGKPRADTWLIRHGGARDTPLVRAQSAKFLISAVARVFEPGCFVKHMLVTRGPQDARKSAAWRALAMRDEWFHDEVEPVGKDGKIGLAGVWIVLDDEFAGLRGGNERKKKSFISRRVEKYRSPYDKWDQRHARQCVLAAAVNDDEILSDPTGGSRYWIVDVRQFDVEALVAEIDQIWAEVVRRYRDGEKWHLTDPKLVTEAARVAEAARARDAWEAPVAKWLAKKKPSEGVTTHEVLHACVFAVEEHMQHSPDEMRDAELRMANLLRTLGWQKCAASKSRRGHLRDRVRVRLFFRGGACPRCMPKRARARGESEKREKDGHPGHSLEIKEENRCPPLDRTLDTHGHLNGTSGAGKPAHAAPPDSCRSGEVATSPVLSRGRGRQKKNAHANGARTRTEHPR